MLHVIVKKKKNDISLFLRAIWFGNHTLHHLFPTLDISTLDLLEPIFYQVLQDFHLYDNTYNLFNSYSILNGKYNQMTRKNTFSNKQRKLFKTMNK